MIIILLILLAIFLFHQIYWRRRKLPPGPLPWPVLGNVPEIFKYPEPGYEMYIDLKKKFGKIYSFSFANLDTVIVGDWDLIKETFIKDGNSYSGRPVIPLTKMYRGGTYGVVETEGERWQAHRRFILQFLRDIGMNKGLMETRVLTEVESFINLLKVDCKKGPIAMQDYFDRGVGSIINSILFGYRFNDSNITEYFSMKHMMNTQVKTEGEPAGFLLAMFPFVRYLPYFSGKYHLIRSNVDMLFDMFDKQIQLHKENIDYDSEDTTDITEAYLKAMKARENEPDFGGFEMIQFKNICFDLFFAGWDTTSNTLGWGILYVLHNADVGRRIAAELSEQIQGDRLVTMDDKQNLPYINAVINETQRMANLLPLNLIHTTTKDVVIDGHHIPADTNIVAQISTVMYDEELFPEPYKFKPERHLDENGHLKKIEELAPFSIGKRQCLGEGLARMELFLFLANLYNQFEIVPVDPKNLPTTKKTFSLLMKPQNYQVNLKPRFIEL